MSAAARLHAATQALAAIKQADEAFERARAAAEAERYRVAGPHHALLRALKEEFQERAFDLACEAGVAPYSRSGGRLDPDDVDVVEEGILLRWDDDRWGGPSYLATWEELGSDDRPE